MNTSRPSQPWRVLRDPSISPTAVYYRTRQARDAAAQEWADTTGMIVIKERWSDGDEEIPEPGWWTDGAIKPAPVVAVEAALGSVLGKDRGEVAAVLFPKDQSSKTGTFYHGGKVFYLDGREPTGLYIDDPEVWQLFDNVYGNVGWYDGLLVDPRKHSARRGSYQSLRSEMVQYTPQATPKEPPLWTLIYDWASVPNTDEYSPVVVVVYAADRKQATARAEEAFADYWHVAVVDVESLLRQVAVMSGDHAEDIESDHILVDGPTNY